MRQTSLGFNSKSDSIDQLVEAGFPLIRLIAGTKTPYTNDWVNTAWDPTHAAADFPDNYGIVATDGHLIIDVDTKNFEPGDDPFVRLKADLGMAAGEEFETFTVQTRDYGGGKQPGLHIYFKKPKGINLKTKIKKYGKGIEIKSFGSMLVGPGSIHPDTKQPYIVVRGDARHLADAPQGILDGFQRNQARDTGTEGYIDNEATRKLFADELASRPVAVEGDDGDPHTFTTAAVGRDLGLPEQVTFDMMAELWNPRCLPPWGPRELAVKVGNAYRYAKDEIGNANPASRFDVYTPPAGAELVKGVRTQFDNDRDAAEKQAGIEWDVLKDATGKITKHFPTLNNVMNMFNLPHYGCMHSTFYELIRLNEFTDRIEFTRKAPWHGRYDDAKEWTDYDTKRFRVLLSQKKRWDPPETIVYDGILAYAKNNSYHPLRERISALVWDGVPRIDQLLSKYAGAEDTIYTRAVSRCLMISLIARPMNPGVKHDYVVILEGDQGVGKSTFCSVLGGDNYADVHLDPHDKDTMMNIRGVQVVELSEFTYHRKADIESVKRFISLTHDRMRRPYGRVVEQVARECVFIATTNETGGYLPDQTGNRRFLPVRTGVFALVELREDLEQLYAEAYEAWKAGENHHITDIEVLKVAKEQQAERTMEDPWAQTVHQWAAREARQGNIIREVASIRIAEEVFNLPAKYVDRMAYQRIANAMKTLGWEPAKAHHQGVRVNGYRNPEYFAQLAELTGGV